MLGASRWFMVMQSSVQFSFFCAQWEEYYTHILPHGCGNYIGVTELNYGLSLWSAANFFIDREKIWTSKLSSFFLLEDDTKNLFLSYALSLEIRHAMTILWVIFVLVQISLSIRRVFPHIHSASLRASAVSKLFTPFLLC